MTTDAEGLKQYQKKVKEKEMEENAAAEVQKQREA